MVDMAVLICERCGMPFDRYKGNTVMCSAYCRFMAKVSVQDTGCWEWTGSKSAEGYGRFGAEYRKSPVYSHRWAYENIGLRRSLVEGMQIDHLCRNRACVNPEHLEQVTPLENLARSENKGAVAVRTGFCHRGHSMEDALTHVSGNRYCRSCANEDRRARYRKLVGRPVRQYKPRVLG